MLYLCPIYGQDKVEKCLIYPWCCGCSRLRRRARRAESRAAASAAVSSGVSADAAVQTDAAASHGDSDELHQQHRHHAADAGSQQQNQAGQAQQGFLRDQYIPDVFCPDSVYQQSPSPALEPPLQNNLPQLDGNDTENDEDIEDEEWINPDPATGLWKCRCCTYAHTFKTEEDLKTHHDTLIFEYDDCNVCYPWHVWT